MKEIREWE
jgi:hypothetical protein